MSFIALKILTRINILWVFYKIKKKKYLKVQGKKYNNMKIKIFVSDSWNLV